MVPSTEDLFLNASAVSGGELLAGASLLDRSGALTYRLAIVACHPIAFQERKAGREALGGWESR